MKQPHILQYLIIYIINKNLIKKVQVYFDFFNQQRVEKQLLRRYVHLIEINYVILPSSNTHPVNQGTGKHCCNYATNNCKSKQFCHLCDIMNMLIIFMHKKCFNSDEKADYIAA